MQGQGQVLTFFFTLFRTVLSSPPPQAVCTEFWITPATAALLIPRGLTGSTGGRLVDERPIIVLDSSTMALSRAYTSAHSQIPATCIRLVSLHQDPHKCLI